MAIENKPKKIERIEQMHSQCEMLDQEEDHHHQKQQQKQQNSTKNFVKLISQKIQQHFLGQLELDDTCKRKTPT